MTEVGKILKIGVFEKKAENLKRKLKNIIFCQLEFTKLQIAKPSNSKNLIKSPLNAV